MIFVGRFRFEIFVTWDLEIALQGLIIASFHFAWVFDQGIHLTATPNFF
jgi:hypothetical protein